MRKIALTIMGVCFITNASLAAKLQGYQEAVEVLKKGERLTLVVDFDQCQIKGAHGAKLTGLSILRLPEIISVRHDQIIAREIIPTGEIEGLPQLGNVYQTSRGVFSKNNQFSATLHVLDPVTFQDKLEPTNITCEIGSGFNVYSSR